MRSIREVLQEHPLSITAAIDIPMLLKLVYQVRKEALEASEAIARRDGHEETGDKIMALQKVP